MGALFQFQRFVFSLNFINKLGLFFKSCHVGELSCCIYQRTLFFGTDYLVLVYCPGGSSWLFLLFYLLFIAVRGMSMCALEPFLIFLSFIFL